MSSCETTEPQNVNTERFYSSSWNVELKRTHGALDLLLQQKKITTVVSHDKMGSMTFDIVALNDHMYQNWGYSWSTDQFFMNWSPCLEWYINEDADSMFLNYDHHDYDVNSGNLFIELFSSHDQIKKRPEAFYSFSLLYIGHFFSQSIHYSKRNNSCCQ